MLEAKAKNRKALEDNIKSDIMWQALDLDTSGRLEKLDLDRDNDADREGEVKSYKMFTELEDWMVLRHETLHGQF